jgi:acetyl esterase/lipase
MKPFLSRKLAVLSCCLFVTVAQALSQNVIRLWSGDAPGALGTAEKDIPTLTVFLPDSAHATGTAIVICPGGGYGHLAIKKEGEDYARFLGMHGVAGFVLKYRLGSDGFRYPAIFYDVQRALRLVRARSSEWRVDPNKIGIIGSSAGGHLASTLLTHFDSGNPNASDPIERVSSRPDFGILCYPVISMGAITHEGSKRNLLGENPSQELVDLLSNEKHITANTPPCFLWHTADDPTVSVQNSLVFAQALAACRVPSEIHIYEHGKHGLGLGDTYPFTHALPWTGELLSWLSARQLIKE